MRVGIIYRDDCWNVIYRAAGLADALISRRVPVEVVVQGPRGELDATRLLGCDVVHVYRRGEPSVRACVDELRRRGIAITWDNDDDLRRLPKEGTKISRPVAERNFTESLKMMRRADIVTTTSPVLAETFRKAGIQHVRVLENYLFPGQVVDPAPTQGGVVVGWVAADEHRADARLLRIAETLRSVMDHHPAVRVVTVGVRLGGLEEDRYTHHRMIPFQQLAAELRTWDVGIAPLADIPMSYARSNVKVKEYAAAGVAWLASARGPYLGLGPEQGGVLVADDGWADRLERLVTSWPLRAELRTRAHAWAATQLIGRHVDEWLQTFQDAIALAHERAGAEAPPRTSPVGRA